MPDEFFDEQSDASRVKTAIITDYFMAWSRVMLSRTSGTIGYVDLFAGPGYYADGSPSTPIQILTRAASDERLRRRLVTVLNDGDSGHIAALSHAIAGIPGIEQMAHRPKLVRADVGDETARALAGMRLIPTLLFVDPWGYKGLTLELIAGVVRQNWGCDALFFFNYNRIHAALHNDEVRPHMDKLFGAGRVNDLRKALAQSPPWERNARIVGELRGALRERGCRFVLPFCFHRPGESRISHYVVFVSKHPLGHKIMKEIMYKASSEQQECGAAPFRYIPVDANWPLPMQVFDPVARLVEMLPAEYSGRSLTMGELFAEHNEQGPYIGKHYKEALKALEAEGRIICSPPAAERPKNTMADLVVIHFPEKSP